MFQLRQKSLLNRLLARIALETSARRLAESRNRLPAIGGTYGTYGTYGSTLIVANWTR